MAKILLAEDDEMISRMISLRLKLRGHAVSVAGTGVEAVEKALGGGYDLVLMDMHMPLMDGHEATRRLREAGYLGPIVAVTASAMSRDSQQAIESGCDGFIPKPLGDDFENLVAGYLAGAAAGGS